MITNPTEDGQRPRDDDYTLDGLSMLLRAESPNGHRIETFEAGPLVESIHLANAGYDGNLPGEARSERTVLGALFGPAKRLVRKAISWYVDPALDRQRAFNANATRTVNEMKRYIDHLQINEDIQSTIMRRDLSLFRANLLFLNRYLERRMLNFADELTRLRGMRPPDAPGAPGEPADARAGNGDNLVNAIDVLTLEQRIYGSPRAARERQKVYLGYLRGSSGVLALGCGRGELLHLLAAQGIPASGAETNPALVDYCRDHELEVARADSIEYLEAIGDGSVGAVVLSRFAGHQPPSRLLRMLQLCRRKLEDGGVLVIETPNPFSLYAAASYALEDNRSQHPLHPEALKLLCLSCGFDDPDVIFLGPLPPEENLEQVNPAAVGAILEPREQELFQLVNENFEKINRILFSHRDYAVVAWSGEKRGLQ